MCRLARAHCTLLTAAAAVATVADVAASSKVKRKILPTQRDMTFLLLTSLYLFSLDMNLKLAQSLVSVLIDRSLAVGKRVHKATHACALNAARSCFVSTFFV